MPGNARSASVLGRIFKLNADHPSAIESAENKQPEVGAISADIARQAPRSANYGASGENGGSSPPIDESVQIAGSSQTRQSGAHISRLYAPAKSSTAAPRPAIGRIWPLGRAMVRASLVTGRDRGSMLDGGVLALGGAVGLVSVGVAGACGF